MADGTKIEWTDATWNPITGCSVVSPGCTNCYAMKLAGTRLRNHESRAGLTSDTKAGPVWNGEVRLNEKWLTQPLTWSRPRMIFVCAHADLFAESVPDAWIDKVFAVIGLASRLHHCPVEDGELNRHVFQLLTKRPERMLAYISEMERCFESDPSEFAKRWGTAAADVMGSPCAAGIIEDIEWPLPNLWLGVSVEDQKRANERIPHLLQTSAALHWISAEPMLGLIDPRNIVFADGDTEIRYDALTGEAWVENSDSASAYDCNLPKLDWVVAGGESGPDARPMHPGWVRSLRDQCATAGVPFLFKQWGEWAPQVGAVDGWTIDDNPEISRFDHRDWEEDRWGEHYRPAWCDDIDDDTVSRIGKKRAGRKLDDVEHDAFPPLPTSISRAAE
ncbi:hypothetical protein ATY81_12360 [Rhizobium sp. R72]|uniref:phage Gp37/Gp68 family protein n=1 Tax=unclassified Rhizobium TaxID=2613769 RepID=UPI000B5337D6|nr:MULTISPECIES: phage Gp37/Gp68 family protein [unclassified Rhizobium]OWV94238.1 hypothetical protein ATY81_12360 [Rhizobium sp. R72]OWV94508.1 hypothetical protein ATY80_12360 [Rhizobium sp. R711]